MSAPDRSSYAARQAQLLDALLGGSTPPDGFAAAKADAAGRALRRKRGHAVAGAWPALALDLGETFGERFDAFARGAAVARLGSPLRDGLAFARRLAASEPLGDDARAELLLARAALHRFGPFAGVVRLRRPSPRLLLVVRLPCSGAIHRSIALPLRPRRTSSYLGAGSGGL